MPKKAKLSAFALAASLRHSAASLLPCRSLARLGIRLGIPLFREPQTAPLLSRVYLFFKTLMIPILYYITPIHSTFEYRRHEETQEVCVE